MTVTDLVVVALALMSFAHTLLLVSLRHRTTRAEVQLRVLRAHVRQLDDAVVWVSPDHRLPPHIKSLDIQR